MNLSYYNTTCYFLVVDNTMYNFNKSSTKMLSQTINININAQSKINYNNNNNNNNELLNTIIN